MKLKILLLTGIFSFFSLRIFAQDVDELILMSEDFPPYNYVENDQLKGSSIELVYAILKKINAKQAPNRIEILPWARSYKLLQEKKNTVLFAMTRTKQRESLFKWVGPISSAKNVLIAMKNKHIKVNANSDFKNYRIGVVRDDAGEQLVSTKLHVDKSKLIIGVNAAPNIRMLTSGRIDLFAYDENVARWTILKENLNHDDFETVLTLEEGKHYIAFNKEISDVVINKFQKALNELKTSGEYNKIMQKYLKSY